MELKLTHESIFINEVVLDSMLEQPIELDYLLPDYCQSIFKVLKCKILPKITSQRIMNGKLVIDGVACIKVIYVSEETYQIRSITQKQVFTKTVELKDDYENGVVNVMCKTDYVNCRVVNQHRLDIRGAISMKATISANRKMDVLTKADGMGVQVDNKRVTALGQKLHSSKEFTIKEELEIGYGKPAMAEVLDFTANALITEYKLIQNKVIVKGEILVHILYVSEVDQKPEIMDNTIPISQIIDVQGINEDYKCVVNFDVAAVELSLKASGDGECRSFDAEFVVRAFVEANVNDQMKVIDDIFSTGYNLVANTSKVKIEELVDIMNESYMVKSSVKIPQNEICCVYDIICEFASESSKYNNGFIVISGNLNISILAIDSENMPIMIEKTTPCEVRLECRCSDEDVIFSPMITIASVSYNMLSADEIEVKAELKICGNLYKYAFHNIVDSVSIDETLKKNKDDDAVLRLYYANSGESVWGIAKQFNTSVDAILLENNLDSDTLSDRGVLLIPIID